MRQDQFNVEVTADGVSLGTFDKFEGGESDSDDTTYRPGNMADAISLGGPKTVSAITVARLYTPERDGARYHWLEQRVGTAEVTVVVQGKNTQKVAVGRPRVYTGTLKTVSGPEVDSDSSDPAMFELQITPNGTVA
jgi:hypothetical protein